MYKALEGQTLADQKQRLKKSTVKTYAAKGEISQMLCKSDNEKKSDKY